MVASHGYIRIFQIRFQRMNHLNSNEFFFMPATIEIELVSQKHHNCNDKVFSDPLTKSFTSSPDVTVTGPSALEIGSAGLYTVTAKVPAPYSALKFNMFGGVNTTNALGACGGRLDSWGDGYSCGNVDSTNFTAVAFSDGDSVGYGRVQLDLGTPLNSCKSFTL